MINNPPRIVADITSFHTGMTCEHCRTAVINEVSKSLSPSTSPPVS